MLSNHVLDNLETIKLLELLNFANFLEFSSEHYIKLIIIFD